MYVAVDNIESAKGPSRRRVVKGLPIQAVGRKDEASTLTLRLESYPATLKGGGIEDPVVDRLPLKCLIVDEVAADDREIFDRFGFSVVGSWFRYLAISGSVCYPGRSFVGASVDGPQ